MIDITTSNSTSVKAVRRLMSRRLLGLPGLPVFLDAFDGLPASFGRIVGAEVEVGPENVHDRRACAGPHVQVRVVHGGDQLRHALAVAPGAQLGRRLGADLGRRIALGQFGAGCFRRLRRFRLRGAEEVPPQERDRGNAPAQQN